VLVQLVEPAVGLLDRFFTGRFYASVKLGARFHVDGEFACKFEIYGI
jgi:hypothetical protein